MRWYLAAPFFNNAEMELVMYLEQQLDSFGIPYFSPRKDGGNDGRQADVTRNKREIFVANANAINECSGMIAILDRQMPKDKAVMLCKKERYTGNWIPDKGPLQQPDLGTVWEMGFAYSQCKPVYGFTERSAREIGTINLMLMEGCQFVFHGRVDLMGFLTADEGRQQSWIDKCRGRYEVVQVE